MEHKLSLAEQNILLYVFYGGKYGACPSNRELKSGRIKYWQRLVDLGLLKLRDDKPTMYVITDKGKGYLK